MKIKFVDVIVLGSGPAGCTASLYAKRAGLEVAMFNGNNPGGQLMITTDVENYPGFDRITGPDLMIRMMDQCKKLEVEMVEGNANLIVKTINLLDRENFFTPEEKDTAKLHSFCITKDKNIISELSALSRTPSQNIIYLAKAVIVATGAKAKWLGLKNETKLREMGGGVSGCATCDGFFYKGHNVAVIGGGNTAAEEALYLANIAAKVYLIHRRDAMRCDDILFKRILKNSKIEIIWDTVIEDMIISEQNKLSGLALKNVKTGLESNLTITGAFIAIGHIPNSEMIKDLVDIDKDGYVITSAGSTKTTCNGIFAAGDIQDKVFRQAATSVGTGCMAAIEATEFINNLKFVDDAI